MEVKLSNKDKFNISRWEKSSSTKMMTDLSPDQQIVEDEIVFVDIPELSRFEIFEGMKIMIENIVS